MRKQKAKGNKMGEIKTPDGKPIWTSVAFWGAIVTAMGMVLPHFGIGKVEDWQQITESWTNLVVTAFQFGGVVMAFLGRYRATQPLSIKKSIGM